MMKAKVLNTDYSKQQMFLHLTPLTNFFSPFDTKYKPCLKQYMLLFREILFTLLALTSWLF